jgi:hypothetical protein
LRRLADYLFPPSYHTLWLNEDLEPITEGTRLGLLEEDYRPSLVEGEGMDFNLYHNDWDRLFQVAPMWSPEWWDTTCREASETACKLLPELVELPTRIAEHAARARSQMQTHLDQLRSRISYLAEPDAEHEEVERQAYAKWMQALIEGIEKPIRRLDSLGAVFLADWTPFPVQLD